MTRGTRILIVDGDPRGRETLQRTLVAHGYRVDCVEGGAACLERLAIDPPDLLLLDTSMPGIDGLGVLRWLRERRGPAELPVILLAAHRAPEEIIAGLEAGANDCVQRPLSLPLLLARIRAALTLKKSVDRLVEAEAHRVKLQALADACRPLIGPLTEIIDHLEATIGTLPDEDLATRDRLRPILDWAHQAGDALERLRKVASYRSAPYTDGLAGFVTASIEQATADGRN